MYEYLEKFKSDDEYISSSENYIIIMASTFVRVYNVKKKYAFKINFNNVATVCVSKDERYLFIGKMYSGYIYVYDMEKHIFIYRRNLMKNSEIKGIYQYNNTELLIWTQSSKDYIIYNGSYNHLYTIIYYNFMEDTFKRHSVTNVCGVNNTTILYDNSIYYQLTSIVSQNLVGDYKVSYYKFENETFLEDEYFHEYCNTDKEIVYSKNMHYYSVFINERISGEDVLLDNERSKIIIYDNSNAEQVLEIGGRKFISVFDVFMNFYRGSFTVDTEGNDVFYTVNQNKIELYNLKKRDKICLAMEKSIMNFYVSFKNDFILIRSPENMTQCYCYIYKLSDFLNKK